MRRAAYSRVEVGDAAVHISEFMLVEYGSSPTPAHLEGEVEALVQMLMEFELERVRDLWWSIARASHPSEGDAFVVRCTAFHRAIDTRMKSRFGRGFAELLEDAFSATV